MSQSIFIHVDKILRKFSLKAIINSKCKILFILFSQEDNDAANAHVKKYMKFISQYLKIKIIDIKIEVKNMKRFIHIASYISLSLSFIISIIIISIIIKKKILILLFIRNIKYIYFYILFDNRNLEKIIIIIEKILNFFINKFKFFDESIKNNFIQIESFIIHLIYRFLELSKFSSIIIIVSENIAWFFLYLYQFIYEKMTIAYFMKSDIYL